MTKNNLHTNLTVDENMDLKGKTDNLLEFPFAGDPREIRKAAMDFPEAVAHPYGGDTTRFDQGSISISTPQPIQYY